MRRCVHRRVSGSGVRLAHDPQSSIDRLCQRLVSSENEKSPRTGGDAAPMPTTPFVGGRD
ncbi:hypothetical protein SBD_3393 [Streptomyces bottropensis ATCC 25435]|uniref:Uncharacterized protein n=1 Tax=Streptomyces bottropensis ATCC 25435 TaxID=1054862 RepID=M3EID0_9ACTN|nr:hypothetical protein SBD_3393 [Streptomyces bottropensis ATCC 25435]